MKIKNRGDIYVALEEISELGDKWHREGIPGPDVNCIRDTGCILEYLYDNYIILPKRIAQTVEEGVYLEFKNGHYIIMEIYNEGGAAILINDFNKIHESIDIDRENRVKTICSLVPKILKG